MANLINEEKNILFSLSIRKSKYLDFSYDREDFENSIPFTFSFDVENESFCYPEEKGATLTLYEIRKLLSSIEDIVNKKGANSEIERFEFSSSECYFDLIFYDTYEPNLVYIEVWINIGSYSDGASYGYDKGFRFVVNVDRLKSFKNELTQQLNLLVND
ncbi:hypothetical protein NSQ59_01460 [Margalitia sp. FSL K6-0131]|uniref:WapI family immunity protein n=1 Tax=Margalitia sp. FSL K6-0131 TaxID=2954604 RepID=UPI0030F867CC